MPSRRLSKGESSFTAQSQWCCCCEKCSQSTLAKSFLFGPPLGLGLGLIVCLSLALGSSTCMHHTAHEFLACTDMSMHSRRLSDRCTCSAVHQDTALPSCWWYSGSDPAAVHIMRLHACAFMHLSMQAFCALQQPMNGPPRALLAGAALPLPFPFPAQKGRLCTLDMIGVQCRLQVVGMVDACAAGSSSMQASHIPRPMGL